MTDAAIPPAPVSTATDDALGALLTLPKPEIADAVIAAALAEHWGLSGGMQPLAGERDLNFCLTTAQGAKYLVKLTHPAESLGMTEFQTGALVHVAERDPELPVPRVIRPVDGALWVALPEGRLRVLSWLEGQPMSAGARSDAQARQSGVVLARLTRALADYSHPAADHVLLWDIRQTPRLVPLLPSITDEALRAGAGAFVARFSAEITPRLAALPWQICHSDLNPHNLLVDPAAPDRITGLIDFGDMVYTPRICDLGVAAAYQIDPARPLERLSAFVAGYASVLPLTAPELDLLFDMITARMITTLSITSWRAARYPENAPYILRNAPAARAGLEAFRAIGADAAARAFHLAAKGA
ncbi:phosphotransferase [Pseudogemmobacter bohemicus]|uniref:phosphotransferase n=1 Tax=Pseudogemmobacter bohemicus TaxID=2250708 RepID=UPI000DD47957|nr:phosphotransferase [Pseudogemmobacter bohemicus]